MKVELNIRVESYKDSNMIRIVYGPNDWSTETKYTYRRALEQELANICRKAIRDEEKELKRLAEEEAQMDAIFEAAML